jgi:hypothetical protein
VVDASALSAFVLREERWRNLAGYLANAVAPDHVVEVANAVWRERALQGGFHEDFEPPAAQLRDRPRGPHREGAGERPVPPPSFSGQLTHSEELLGFAV